MGIGRRPWEPAGALCLALEVDQTLALEGLEDRLDAPGSLAGQNLLQLLEPGPFPGFALGRPPEALDAGAAPFSPMAAVRR